MLNINDTVVYGSHGVCTVEGITEKTVAKRTERYFVLKNYFSDKTTIYVPVENELLLSRMHTPVSGNTAGEIIDRFDDLEYYWFDSSEEREKKYKEVILSGDTEKLMMIIKTISKHSENQKHAGRKLHQSDEKIFREAQKVLFEELAYALQVTTEHIGEMMSGKISVAL